MRQPPVARTFGADSCPAQGKRKSNSGFFDPQLNVLKNRIDWPKNNEFLWVLPSAITEHASPNLQGQARSEWQGAKRDSVTTYEGLPLVISGFVVDDSRYESASGQGAEQQGPESTNCGAEKGDGDIHIWIAPGAHQRYGNAIVVEMTPRVIAENGWGDEAGLQSKLKKIADLGVEVEVYGWLLFDQEHFTQLKSTSCGARFCPRRKTLWELHPVMELLVRQGAEFVPLAGWNPD